MSKTVIILGGGDWNDASCDQVEVLDDLDMQTAHHEYRTFVHDLPSDHPARSIAYKNFTEWLKENKGATDGTVEMFWEDCP